MTIPTEYPSAVLAGCLTTGLVFHVAAQGIKIEVESKLSGHMDLQDLGVSKKTENGFEPIDVAFDIKAEQVSQDKP